MIRKRIFTLLTAAFMVLAFSATAFAVNNVRLTTTVPNIPKSTCYQAGTITMEIDDNTAIAEGDVIQFTLNNKVTSCKVLNMWLRIANVAGALDLLAAAPVSTSGGTVNVIDGTHEWGFLVKAINADSVAGQIITMQLRVRDTGSNLLDPLPGVRVMTFSGTAVTDKLFVKIFDEKIAGTQSGFFEPLVGTPTVYDTPITTDDNMICIDTLTQDYMDEYVQATPDSLPVAPANELIFSGDYRIAHIMPSIIESLVPCGGKVGVGHIEIGAQGQPDTCESFDFETVGTAAGNGYCADHLANNKLIIASSGTFVPSTTYKLAMQIIVERGGVAKAIPGVYWSNTGVEYAADTFARICGNLAAFTAPGGETYLRSDGLTASTAPRAPGVDCDLTADEKAVYLTTGANITIPASTQYFTIDLPDFNYVLNEILAGDVVKIKVTLTTGCTTIGSLTINIGTFGCTAGPIFGSRSVCPYVTTLAAWDPAADGTFWNGIAITNYNNAIGTVDLTAYKQDGTTATVTISIPANGMVVNYVSALGWTGSQPDGVPAWITLTSADIPFGSLDAFVMMSDNTSQSMGYLCR